MTCEDGAVISGGDFKSSVTVDAAGGTVTEWSADAYDTLYVVPETRLTLKATRKLTGIVSDGKALDYTTNGSTVTFTIGTAP